MHGPGSWNHRPGSRAAALLVALALGRADAAAQCDHPASIGGSGGASRGVDVEGGTAFSIEHGRLTSFDVSDPAHPLPLGTVFLSNNFLWDVKVDAGLAVCADAFWGVRLVDVRHPDAPQYLSVLDTPYGPESVAIADGIVYAADGQSSVRVIDVSDPHAPFLRASVPISHGTGGWYVQEVVIDGPTLYVGSEAYGKVALDVVDVANPSAPVILGSLVFTPGYPVGLGDLALDGATVFLSDTSAGLHVVDVADPAAPAEVGTLPGPAGVLQPYGELLLLGRGASLDVVDVQDPSAPALVTNVATPGTVDDIALTGAHALLATTDAGLATLDLAVPAAPVLVSVSRTPDQAADVALDGGLAYVADGPAGVKVLDLANPIVPTPLAQLDTPGSATGLALDAGLLYVADGAAGLAIADVHAPSAPALIGTLDTPGSAVEVAVQGGFAYVADGAQGLSIADVSDPTAPSPVGQLPFPGVNTFATAVHVAGGFAYLTDTYYGLRIVDVSDPASPVLRSTTDTYSYANDVVVEGSHAFVADYSRRIYVMDVSNPDAPVVLWYGPINSSAEKIALVGDRLYLTQNQGGYMETYDVSIPGAPVQLTTIAAPTGGGGIAHENGILMAAHGANGVQTFRADGLAQVSGPAAVPACGGGPAELYVAAAGQVVSGGVLLGFQWRRDGAALADGPTGTGSTVDGATTAVLSVSSPSAADQGAYDCVVTDACGAAVSEVAALELGGSGCVASYCFGVGCPCGNDDPTAGCAHGGGGGAQLTASGGASVSADDLVLTVSNSRPNQAGILYMGGAQVELPFGDGLRCVAAGPAAVCRFPVQNGGAAGVLHAGPGIVAFSLTQAPGCHIHSGDTWNFQGWYRDPAGPCGGGFNLSNGASVAFTP